MSTLCLSKIPPGECRPDIPVEVSGNLVYYCQLSLSMALFTLEMDAPLEACEAAVLDIVLTRSDGWDSDVIDELFEHLKTASSVGVTIAAEGYLERMLAKHDTEVSPLRLIPRTIQIGDRCFCSVVEKEDHNNHINEDTTPKQPAEQDDEEEERASNNTTTTNNNKSTHRKSSTDRGANESLGLENSFSSYCKNSAVTRNWSFLNPFWYSGRSRWTRL